MCESVFSSVFLLVDSHGKRESCLLITGYMLHCEM